MMKIAGFFENAGLINQRFGIVPLMYGSLGLEYIMKEDLRADDVDILIPQAFIGERWGEFCRFLAEEGYVLVDEHEHTFEKNGIRYAYARVEELESFAGIRLCDIARRQQGEIPYRLLSLKQYLQVYRASAKDGYRIEVREKKDHEKIARIERRLQDGAE